jgi:hypothetical protein
MDRVPKTFILIPRPFSVFQNANVQNLRWLQAEGRSHVLDAYAGGTSPRSAPQPARTPLAYTASRSFRTPRSGASTLLIMTSGR